MVKLTIDVVEKSSAFINPLKDREMDLRDNKIPAIENLAIMRDQNDTIDFTNNDIRRLENFPLAPRLKTLLLANNRIQFIDRTIGAAIPNIENLILSNNALSELGDIEALSAFKKLQHLSLIDNPVTQREHYRQYVVFQCPLLRMLDFSRITAKERKAAEDLFSGTNGQALRDSLTSLKTGTFDVGTVGGVKSSSHAKEHAGLSADERAKLKEAIANAKSLDEVTRLERILQTGRLTDALRK